MSIVLSNDGYCVTCDSETTFSSSNEWLRDFYLCGNCGSIPRERALMYCIERYYPKWKDLSVHESSPSHRGASAKLKKYCKNYLASHFFSGIPPGKIHSSGFRNEDLENQTFADESFDLVITQDVMEHIFDPARAFTEIARVLKPGGAHIFSVPLINKEKPSEIWASRDDTGKIVHLKEPEYHGNPIDDKGSLVTMHWGYDISDFVLKHGGLYTTINYIDNLSLGIRAEYIEILVSRKINA
ncbi:MAG: class I SAM-dependent methyltransferase [Nitrospirae bacterium]|nr:class I SAM-dependent methyltransferase [Nitrospirota bacterium]